MLFSYQTPDVASAPVICNVQTIIQHTRAWVELKLVTQYGWVYLNEGLHLS